MIDKTNTCRERKQKTDAKTGSHRCRPPQHNASNVMSKAGIRACESRL